MKFIIYAVISLILLCLSQFLVYFYAPVEESMGLAQKIFYLHLPFSWWGLVSFFLVFIFSILFLVKKNIHWDNWARTFSELGVLFAILALLTGMIWGRSAWGVWWTWDPRLTTTLIMVFIYTGYLIVENLDFEAERKAVIRAAIGIIAFIDVPLVFFSARIFRTIHPAVFASNSGDLEPEMKFTIYFCLAATGSFWFLLAMLRKRQLFQLNLYKKIEYNRLYEKKVD